MQNGNPNDPIVLPEPLRQFAAAVLLLTRLPLPWQRISNSPPDNPGSLWAYPLVGLLLGILAANVYWLAQALALPNFIASLLAVAALIGLTGAMHEDGLADVADGFGGGHDPAQKLEIMKDSRIGTFGAVSLMLSLMLRVGALAILDVALAPIALIIAAVASRYGILLVMSLLTPARPGGLGASAGRPSLQSHAIAGAISLALAFLLLDFAVLATIVFFSALVLLAFIWLARRQIGGFTGDVLGAAQQLAEITILLCLTAYWTGG